MDYPIKMNDEIIYVLMIRDVNWYFFFVYEKLVLEDCIIAKRIILYFYKKCINLNRDLFHSVNLLIFFLNIENFIILLDYISVLCKFIFSINKCNYYINTYFTKN